MFRTARGFLLLAPPAFLAALCSILFFYPGIAAGFSPYPVLLSALGRSLAQRPLGRFAAASTLFFLLPYVSTGLLLLLADVGVGAASRLWTRRPSPGDLPRRRVVVPEARFTFIAVGLLMPVSCGFVLVRFAKGGELPGGVNIAPLIVAAYPFATTGIALLSAFLVGLPRSLYRWAGGSPSAKKEQQKQQPIATRGTKV